MKKILALFLLFSAIQLPAQDLLVEYDFETQTYQINGDKKVKKGALVHLKINNLNTYLFQVSSTASSEKFDIGPSAPLDFSDFQPSSSFSGEPGGFPAFNLWFGALLSGKDYSFEIGGKEVVAGKEEDKVLETIRKSTFALRELEAEIDQSFESLRSMLTINDAIAIAKEEIRFLKRSPKVSTIKDETESLSRAVFGTGIDEVGMQDLLQYRALPHQVKQTLKTLQHHRNEFDGHLRKAILTLSSVAAGEMDPDIKEEVDDLLLRSNRLLQSMDENIRAVQQDTANLQSPPLKDLIHIRDELRNIRNTPFTHTNSFIADGDEMILHIQVSADSMNAGNQNHQLTPLRIPVYGGLKINASVGLALGQFFNPGESYFHKDSTIHVSQGDRFIPSVGTFVHFYPRRAGSFAIGGSLGVGFSVAGSSATESSPSFFLGPSLIFGQAEQLVLSLGLQGGKVRRLSRGLKVGDVFDPGDGDIPTEPVYELGYFMGVSFNLGRR